MKPARWAVSLLFLVASGLTACEDTASPSAPALDAGHADVVAGDAVTPADTTVPDVATDSGSPIDAVTVDAPAPADTAPDTLDAPAPPSVTEVRMVVPSADLPPEVTTQDANNNLDIVMHDGRLFLAFRTAPTHFASDLTMLYVVSTEDEQTWRFEGSFARETDLREPRLLSFGGELWLHFAVLGSSPIDFTPFGAMHTRYLGPGKWSEPEWFGEDGFIPWRTKVVDGVAYMVGYIGGENIYDRTGEPLQVLWLTTKDGEEWTPVVPGQAAVQTGGGSETDFVFLDDGTLIAVTRNEEGDELGFGSKICRALPSAPGDWKCVPDPRKYDSPLVFRHGNEVYLIGRRNVTETGNYDLGLADKTMDEKRYEYQIDYWNNPKRCSVWHVDKETLEVALVLDLPSKGDTCFPGLVPKEGGRYLIYNYSSPIDGDDVIWLDGQLHPTGIYRQVLELP